MRIPLPAAGNAGGTLCKDVRLPPSGRLGLQKSALLLAWSLMEIAGICGPLSKQAHFWGAPGQ